MNYKKPRTEKDKKILRTVIRGFIFVKKWNRHLENQAGVCPTKDDYYNYVANVTWGGLDFCAGGQTEIEAENNLYNFLVGDISPNN